MTTTTHTIDATDSGTTSTGMDFDIEFEITFSYQPGAPDTHDEPGYAAEIEFVSISPGAGDHGGFTDLAQKHLEEWATGWLDDHFAECCNLAEAERQPDPDAARDARLDRERDR